jgi:adenosylmethionine-8-amino-7-oxononanoate aminotransferase
VRTPRADPEWLSLDRAHVWHPHPQAQAAPPPLPVARAEGVWLELADGRKVLDGISSGWVNLFGHNHPKLNAALSAQMVDLGQVMFSDLAHEPAARLAAELIALAPTGLSRVFYADDGATAVEVAMRMAIQLWRQRGDERRRIFVALDHGCHGDIFEAMAGASGAAGANWAGSGGGSGVVGDAAFAVQRAPVPACESEVAAALADLAALLDRGNGEVAGVLVEPIVQGGGGMRIHPPSFLRGLREATRARGLPLIADEGLTGFGRTGRMFACEHAGIAPDLLCLSSGLTGGYLPLAATLATEEIHAAFHSAERGRSLGGPSCTANALACSVARAGLAHFTEAHCLARIGELHRLFAGRLAVISALPGVARVRGIGGLAVVELEVRAKERESGQLATRVARLVQEFLDRGVLLRPLGNVVYFLPPYAISDDECHRVFDILEETLLGSRRMAGR